MRFTRRKAIQATAGLAVSAAGLSRVPAAPPENLPGPDWKIRNGRIHQSVMAWCFDPMPPGTLMRHAKAMGLEAIEGIDAKYFPLAREHGLKVSLAFSHMFETGPFSRDNHPFCLQKLREGIEAAAEFGCPSVLTFTGMREPGISDEQGARNCVDCWKQVIGYAEKKNITLVMEHLNTRDHTHPMKGHPGYFGNDVELCVDLIQRVGSPNMKLLFDVYHVQIMNGDLIRRIRQHQDIIGHYHAAGVPGRGELAENQEINYPAVMRAILETGFQGYMAQEFLPTWPDPIAALRHAVRLCDV